MKLIKFQKIKYLISITPTIPYHQLSHIAPLVYLQLPQARKNVKN